MGIFDDFFGGGSSGGSIVDSVLGGIGGNILNDIILRQVTSEEQRAVRGIGLPGDTPFGRSFTNALQGLPTFGGPGVATNGLGFVDSLLGQSISATGCPTTAGVAVPAGACFSIGDVVAGNMKGMCFVGVSPGGTPILKKRSRRRRRKMFTQSDKNDISWALQAAGSPKGPAVLQGIMHKARG